MIYFTLNQEWDIINYMIRQILLYKSDKISVYCTPAVEKYSLRRLSTFVKAAVAAEKTLIKDITKKYPKSKNIHYKFLYKNYKLADALGACDQEFDGDILIELNAKNMGSHLCTTIGHELVHARQFISGQLEYNNRIKYYTFEGERHRYIYRKQPWELEAYALQDKGAIKMKRWLLDHVHYNPKFITSIL